MITAQQLQTLATAYRSGLEMDVFDSIGELPYGLLDEAKWYAKNAGRAINMMRRFVNGGSENTGLVASYRNEAYVWIRNARWCFKKINQQEAKLRALRAQYKEMKEEENAKFN